MNSSMSRPWRQKVFAWIAIGCLALAVGYVSWVLLRAKSPAPAQLQEQGPVRPVARPEELQAIQKSPHLLFLQPAGPHYGQVALTEVEPERSQRAQTELVCDRVHYAAGNGICLIYDSSTPAQDFFAPIPTWVRLFGPDFKTRHEFTVEGVPSRARVSPDGKYAAFTVFVTGHSYADANMSTATALIDIATGTSLGNLEEFEVWKDGRPFEAIDFNFWGVTFAKDSTRFYATLRSVRTTYLLEGDIPSRRLTILRENVECPSLSPDGTRIAFKKLTPTGMWHLTILDLATMQETPLSETESIDDQVEWLDNQRILYQKADHTPARRLSVFVVPADGSGQPEVFLLEAESPAVIRN